MFEKLNVWREGAESWWTGMLRTNDAQKMRCFSGWPEI